MAGAALRSSGQRGSTGASSWSAKPRARRSAPAQAIIAALSPHKLDRRHVEGEAARFAQARPGWRAGAALAATPPATTKRQRSQTAEARRRKFHAARAAIGHRHRRPPPRSRRRCRPRPARVSGLSFSASAPHRRLQAGKGEVRLIASEHRARQVEAARISLAARSAPPPGRPGSRDPTASPSCRRLRPARRRWSCRAARSRRRRARSRAACGRRRRAAAGRAARTPSVRPTVSACASR